MLRRFREEDAATIRGALLRASASSRTELLGGPSFSRTLKTLFGLRVTEPTRSLRTQAQWIALSLADTHPRLVEHLQQNRHFLRALLTGTYSGAREILLQIEKIFGQSLWTCHANLLLAQIAGGLEANRKYLQEIREHCGSMATILLEYMSQCAETEMSYAQYLNETDTLLRALEEQAGVEDLGRWMRFRLCPLSLISINDPERILCGEERLAAIDRYNGLVRLLQLVSSKRTAIEPIVTETLHVLADATRQANQELSHILLALGGQATVPSIVSPLEAKICDLAEAYTIGDYDIVINECQSALKEAPEVFELYELYVSACAHRNTAVAPMFEPDTVASMLLQLVNSCILRNEHATSLDALTKLSVQLDDFQLGHQIAAFCIGQQGHPTLDYSRAAATSATVLTPRFAYAFIEPGRGVDYLSRFGSKASAQIFRSVLMRDANQIVAPIPPLRMLKYQGTAALLGKRAAEARDTFKKLQGLAAEAGVIPDAYAATLGLFRSYLSLSDFSSAAELVIAEHLAKSAYLDGLPLSMLARELQPLRPLPSIVWSIFWWIYFDMRRTPVSERRKIYEMYDDYLRSMNCKYPIDLRPRYAEIPRHYLILFLARVCNLDTMSSSWRFRGTERLEEQRVKICEDLAVLDPDHAHEYRDEVAQLLRRAATREIIKQVDRTRIYVNVKGIRESLDQTFVQRFVRFRAYSDLGDAFRRGALFEDIPDFAKAFKNSPNLRFYVISDRGLQLLGDLFRDIRQRYISSNEYGLDSYLSVRVRHGVLSGQIRGFFERHHLITQRPRPETPYEKNVHWEASLKAAGFYGQDTIDKALGLLQELSQNVDSLIADFRNEILQIKSATKPRGVFDYELGKDTLFTLFSKAALVKDYEKFLDLVFEALWKRTATNLETTVNYIRNELQAKLLDMLNRLEGQLQAIGIGTWASLISEIRSCRTDMGNELEVIAGWFSIIRPNEFPRFSVHDACSSLIEAIKRILPSYDTTIRLDIPWGIDLRGELLTSFYDMMLIVLVNAVRHSGLSRPRVELKIFADADLHIQVSNPLNGTEPGARIAMETLNISPSKWQLDQNVRAEGGSGLAKLRRILSYDFGLDAGYMLTAMIRDSVFTVEIRIPMNKVKP